VTPSDTIFGVYRGRPVAADAIILFSMPIPSLPPLHALPPRLIVACWLALAALLWLPPALAQAQTAPYEQVHRLLQAQALEAALAEADGWLAAQPRDPQMRFLRGVIRQRQGDSAGAEATFEALIRDYPELPEPYNNLAVIRAARGELAPAREALLHALRLYPEYATAHRNLADLYLQMAAESYRAALRTGPESAAIAQQLQAVERLLAKPPSP
jgi:tetratricopeptide (TPR) repeat protein